MCRASDPGFLWRVPVKQTLWLAVTLSVCAMIAVASAQAQPAGEASHVLRQFGAGGGANALGVLDARLDVEVEGPV